MRKLKRLFERNRQWAKRVTESDPSFFQELSKEQNPEYLWIGCSDSRAPANVIVDMPPGSIFVHRNIANTVIQTDLNCLSVIQFAVDVLKIKHIVVCGHYGCGGIRAAMENQALGLIDNWLQPIKDLYLFHKKELDQIPDIEERVDRLCEINVVQQVAHVCHTPTVQAAWKNGQEIAVHGWIYGLRTGLLQDLGVCTTSLEEAKSLYQSLWKIS